ncbi:MAG: hypothetical protein ACRD4C_05675 [Candidatus Acidiferrales bacterium]
MGSGCGRLFDDHARRKQADHPDRIAAINKQKAANLPTPPSPVVTLKMYGFGDGVLEVAETQLSRGQRQRMIHVWHKRDGQWKLIVTYGTPIDSSPVKP